MASKTWRTLEFVVRVPVQGEVSMTGMCHNIASALNDNIHESFRIGVIRGKFRVASLKRVEAAKKRKR
jgi:hypothetical protein